MTPEQINTTIAEWMGYTNIRYDWINGSDAIKDWMHSKGRGIPDFYNDLNAIHEAEKKLTLEQSDEYEDTLATICAGKFGCKSTHLFRAEAPQRCEALLKTIGKWI